MVSHLLTPQASAAGEDHPACPAATEPIKRAAGAPKIPPQAVSFQRRLYTKYPAWPQLMFRRPAATSSNAPSSWSCRVSVTTSAPGRSRLARSSSADMSFGGKHVELAKATSASDQSRCEAAGRQQLASVSLLVG